MSKKFSALMALCSLAFPAISAFAQPVDTAWVRRYNGPGISLDFASAMAVDGSGNVYVTGNSGDDYATIKYAPDGETLWVRRYNGPGNGGDLARALAVDGSGNVYVTGSSLGDDMTYADYATIKYAPNGDTLWVRRYDRSTTGEVTAIAVDGNGNVYVTGSNWSWETGWDYETIKYSPDGDTEWVRRYNRPDAFSDEKATALAVDGSGNVYVTGGGHDYVTIKYAANGNTLWVQRYDGPTHGFDHSQALAVDESGNVYVTGWTEGSYPYGANIDYATIKYAPNGAILWVRPYTYNGPANGSDFGQAIAVDGSRNVYVTGWSGIYPLYDYATIKYAPDGDTLWVRRFGGPNLTSANDRPMAMAVDASGNVYVTGDTATIKYLPNGDTGWVRTNGYYGQAIVVDDSDNVYLTGSDGNYVTTKYAPNGDPLWVSRYDPPGNGNDHAAALTVDGSGNVYVTGRSENDCATIKYAPDGETLWVRRYGFLSASALAVDGSGNVYVTGRSENDCAAIKYAPDGDTLWVRHYGGEYANALAVDESGNVYVAANFGDRLYSNPVENTATIKYAPDGETLWARRDSGRSATALAVDENGNVYVTGSSGLYPGPYDYATIKYTPDGETLWVRRYNGPGSDDNRATAIALDGSGNVYVTGWSGLCCSYDYATIKYSPDGDTLWVRRYSGPGDEDDRAAALAVDGSGKVYVTGRSGTYLSGDYATILYAPNGYTLWIRRYNGPGNGDDETVDLAVDGSGNVYVTGSSWGVGTFSDYATIKYLPLPQLKGDLNLDGVLDPFDVVLSLNCIFLGEPPPAAPITCDLNCDGKITPADVVNLLLMVFAEMPAPC